MKTILQLVIKTQILIKSLLIEKDHNNAPFNEKQSDTINDKHYDLQLAQVITLLSVF